MERLTERYDIAPDGESDVWVKQHDYISAARKLCDYEDLEEKGLLVRLPCKVGDDIYVIPSQSIYGINIVNGFEKLNRVYRQHIESITFFDGHWYATSPEEYGFCNKRVLNDIAYGITWFTDYEEAEKKLEEMKNE